MTTKHRNRIEKTDSFKNIDGTGRGDSGTVVHREMDRRLVVAIIANEMPVWAEDRTAGDFSTVGAGQL